MAKRIWFGLLFAFVGTAGAADCKTIVCSEQPEASDIFAECCTAKNPLFGAKETVKSCAPKSTAKRKNLPGDPIVIETGDAQGSGDAI